MNLKQLVHVLAISLLFSPRWLLAYEIETHAKMSEAAAQASVLKDTSQNGVLRSLGLNYPIDDNRQVFPNSKGRTKNILLLIEDGARFEDSFNCTDSRPRNHFFDPLSGSGLNWNAKLIGGVGSIHVTGIPSPDWALEDNGKQPDQEYSWKSARDYLYKALTTNDKDIRGQDFGLAFQALGQIVHHIEDMAQPQHVRSDPHYASPPNCGAATYLGKVIKENFSRYEKYTDEVRDGLRYDTYPPVNQPTDIHFLANPRLFWTGSGLGIADFTNSNFLSASTNFRGAFQNGQLIALPNARYPLPAPSLTVPTFTLANNLLGQDAPPECDPPNNPCVMAFFSSEVTDHYRTRASDTNSRASTASIFDQDLQLYGKSVSYPNLDKCTDPTNPGTCEQIETNQIFSLNRFNFDAAHEFLIPRAVAYSAGLINYFFRGRLEAASASSTDDGTNLTATLQVKNVVDPSDPAASADVLYALNGSTPSTLTLAVHYTLNGKDQYAVSSAMSMDDINNPQDPQIAPGRTSQNVCVFKFDPEMITASTTRSPS